MAVGLQQPPQRKHAHNKNNHILISAGWGAFRQSDMSQRRLDSIVVCVYAHEDGETRGNPRFPAIQHGVPVTVEHSDCRAGVVNASVTTSDGSRWVEIMVYDTAAGRAMLKAYKREHSLFDGCDTIAVHKDRRQEAIALLRATSPRTADAPREPCG